jgi:cyclopropane fatty-acyl-phospholipid synthase-like methyltransferase
VSDDVERVRAYYDHNTASFLETGQGGASIRRAVWAPGVASREDAFRTIDRRVLAAIVPGARVVDLGCGVGSSLLWLSERADFDGAGVTLSGVQAKFFTEDIARRGLGAKLRCFAGSFVSPPPEVRDVDLAFSIEAFVHAPSAEAYFAGVAPRLKPGAQLLILDDFLEREASTPAERRTVEDVREGWLANTLSLPAEVEASARAAGLALTGNEDWTPWLELGRPRDRLLAVVARVGRPFRARSWLLRSWVGGVALQRALSTRLVCHRLLTFRKT